MTVQERFNAEMKRIWGNDQKMIDFCTKKVFELVELSSEHIFVLDKPTIVTSFCFGYGQFGNSTDEEMESASERCRNAHKFESFKKANIEYNFGRILRQIENGYCYIVKYDCGQDVVSILLEYDHNTDWAIANNKVVAFMTDDDRIKIKEAVNRSIAKFEKRLTTYWKKYQDTKLTTWTYLVD